MATIDQIPPGTARNGARMGGRAALAAATADVRPVLPVILYILAVLTPVFFHAGPLMLSMLRLMLLIMIVPLFFNLLAGRYGKLIATDYLFFAHVGWMVIAFAVTNPDRIVENIGSAALEFLGGYLMGRAFIRSKADFIAFCKWLTYITAAMLPLALYETRTGDIIIPRIINSLPGLSSYFPHGNDPRLGLNRVQGTLAHAIHFGLFCSIAFALCFTGLKGIFGTQKRLLFSAAVFICTFLSLSAGTLLALVIQIGLITWYFLFRNQAWKWKLLITLSVIAYIVVDLISNRSPVEVFISYATFSPHTGYWRMIIFEWGMMNIFGSAENNIEPAFLFGIGLAEWVRPWFMYSGSMDNFWLVIGVRYGFPGFLLLALGYGIALIRIALRDFSGDEELMNLRRAWVFTFAGLTFTLFTVHVWSSLYSFVFFVFGAGMWMLATKATATSSPATADEEGGLEAQFETKAQPAASPYSRFPLKSAEASEPDVPSSGSRMLRTRPSARSRP